MFTDRLTEVQEANKKYHFSTKELDNYSINILYLSSFIKSFQSYLGFSTFETAVEISFSEAEITLYKKDGYGSSTVELNRSCWLMDEPKVFTSMLNNFEKIMFDKVKKELKEWE